MFIIHSFIHHPSKDLLDLGMWQKTVLGAHIECLRILHTHLNTSGLSVNIYVNLNYTKGFLKTRSSFYPTEQLTVLCSGQGSINIFWLNEILNDTDI